MRILEYVGLDTSGVTNAYQKVSAALAAGDFRSAQVRKLTNLVQGKFYRARLNDADRLLFALISHAGEVDILMLEVIRNHAYGDSPFLRGAPIDEAKIPECGFDEARQDAQPLRYLHPERTDIHLLDKPISFDDAQEQIYRMAPPLVIVGSAGSGKTALTLEKLKQTSGEVLYVTRSAYLAQNARDLYHAHGFEREDQVATFLSYKEFLESIRIAPGREAGWNDFVRWFARMRQAFRDLDAHQAFEEIRGVISAAPEGVLSRDAYLALGVKQSIFTGTRREAAYALFEKYCSWLAAEHLYDLNLVAHRWMPLAAPRYDFLVVDEVQDITPVQLALVLRTLKKPGEFLLCGDSNQIVHPNFFSWAQVKSLFWSDPSLAQGRPLQLLTANFRNGREATRVANRLLKIRQRRFGSIDRESNFLVRAVGDDAGSVNLLPDKEAVKRDLDQRTRRSTRFAVLVMRDEDKAEARKYFSTPLLFSIHEAKGLEYENIILYRFVSDHRTDFAEVTAGVAPGDLESDDLGYGRAKDKDDKSLQVYKFFVNSLYVALTRATRNLYLIESDVGHPLFSLLGLAQVGTVDVQAERASLDDWQREARKLELQGKQEQAEAIREGILRHVAVPWPVFDQDHVRALLGKVFRDHVPGNKLRQQLYEIAACHDLPLLARSLVQEARYDPASHFQEQRLVLRRKTFASYAARNYKDVLQLCERHGIDHRLPMNLTPLMAAAVCGNVPLVEALVERGADREAQDDFGCNALHWAMREAFRDARYAREVFASLYELLAPSSLDVSVGEQLERIDRQMSEYLVFQTFWALFATRYTRVQRRPYAAFETKTLLEAWENLPSNVVNPRRNRRAHLSSVLSRNEIDRDYAYNRALFRRVAQGWYQFNPALFVRRRSGDADAWVPVYRALNLPWVGEFASELLWHRLDEDLRLGGLPSRTAVPIIREQAVARQDAARRADEAAQRAQDEEVRKLLAQIRRRRAGR